MCGYLTKRNLQYASSYARYNTPCGTYFRIRVHRETYEALLFGAGNAHGCSAPSEVAAARPGCSSPPSLCCRHEPLCRARAALRDPTRPLALPRVDLGDLAVQQVRLDGAVIPQRLKTVLLGRGRRLGSRYARGGRHGGARARAAALGARRAARGARGQRRHACQRLGRGATATAASPPDDARCVTTTVVCDVCDVGVSRLVVGRWELGGSKPHGTTDGGGGRLRSWR